MSGGVTGKICSQHKKHTHTHQCLFLFGVFFFPGEIFQKIEIGKIGKRG
jgi:hypothetical protein